MSQDNQQSGDDLSIDVDYGGHTDDELAEYDTGSSKDIIEVKRNAPDKFIKSLDERGRSDSIIEKYKRTLAEFVKILNTEEDGEHPCNVTDEHINTFNEHLKGSTDDFLTIDSHVDELSDRTRSDYLSLLAAFYAWLEQENTVGDNPARRVKTKLKERGDIEIEKKDRPAHELEEMMIFLNWLESPFHKAWFLFLLKTGARRGGIVNVDLRDLHIDHPDYQHLIDEYDIQLSRTVEDKPDSVHVMNDIESGEIVRGEERECGIKEGVEVGRTVPIDDELKTALMEYLLSRPRPKPTQPCHPLFLMDQRPDNGIGSERITDSSIDRRVFGKLEEYGWYSSGAGVETSVDNHYFRHYITVNHRYKDGFYGEHIPDPVIAYIRGDKDSADTARNEEYSHTSWTRWHEIIEEPYLSSIYQFGVYE